MQAVYKFLFRCKVTDRISSAQLLEGKVVLKLSGQMNDPWNSSIKVCNICLGGTSFMVSVPL